MSRLMATYLVISVHLIVIASSCKQRNSSQLRGEQAQTTESSSGASRTMISSEDCESEGKSVGGLEALSFRLPANKRCAFSIAKVGKPIALVIRGLSVGAYSKLQHRTEKFNIDFDKLQKSFELKDLVGNNQIIWLPPMQEKFTISLGTLDGTTDSIQIDTIDYPHAGEVGSICHFSPDEIRIRKLKKDAKGTIKGDPSDLQTASKNYGHLCIAELDSTAAPGSIENKKSSTDDR